jgi:hypothetical protein
MEEALRKLCTMSTQITITAGKHHYREGFEPHYLWEVIALQGEGQCYPPFAQEDDFLIAVQKVIEQIEEQRAGGAAFLEEFPELKALPVVETKYLIGARDDARSSK